MTFVTTPMLRRGLMMIPPWREALMSQGNTVVLPIREVPLFRPEDLNLLPLLCTKGLSLKLDSWGIFTCVLSFVFGIT